MADWRAGGAGGPVRGRITVPGDKSVSHRAIMLAALADGVSRIEGFLEGEDTRATARIFGRMGVRIEAPEAGVRIVHGVGIDGLRAPDGPLDCGNSGTAMRLLAGLLAAQPFACALVGDESLSRRPMRRITDPLASMGARIDTRPDGTPPLRISPAARLAGIDYASPVASAQVKSALLLAGLYGDGETTVREPHPTRDYTERMLRAFGVDVAYAPGHARLRGGQRLCAGDVRVPGDFSSAAFAIVAATLLPGSELLIENVGIDPRRIGLLSALRLMGADIEIVDPREEATGAIADLRVRHARLRGIEVPVAVVPDMIDEFPVLFAAAACAEGTTRVRGAAELRVKESDRIAAMASGLAALGIEVRETPDGVEIVGGRPRGGHVRSLGDHRIAMSFAVLAQCAAEDVRIEDIDNVATSYPGFDAGMRGIGLAIETVR
ncbi:3-phosphoshikimate 1-carboxyvinyltransferase [Lysobacter pythonis]|uniref:3-phosphoshikimate 1-carboxyvinyltransferase n=1 Tax=Solilutibacter pythonis TaxID=2483112 RepID=A0A3M2HZ21_9GAMM|nr:3-phosphoshikimate 1-carboxyvinyltransferase [Lysobacter pythonis]RMH94991.1 3-phosphoshikimate 1-carboxyvinyltransferase [Lysobacter pythonis]